jgi:hypothetical protein
VTFQLAAPRKPEPLRHDPPQEIRRDLRFVHYWRDTDGQWHGGQPITAAKDLRVSRGDVLFANDDTLFFYFADRLTRQFHCLEARAEDQWRTWRCYPLVDANVTGKDASKHDRTRWAREGVLSFTSQQKGKGFGIVDLVPAEANDGASR